MLPFIFVKHLQLELILFFCRFIAASVARRDILVCSTMADSDRSRSPVPGRNRTEPRGQVQAPRPELPFFPQWRGPMNSAILHSQNTPRPQFRPQWATNQSGPYMMGRMMNPTPSMMQTNWSNHQFPPAPPSSPPPTLPYILHLPVQPLHLARQLCHVHQHNRALRAHLQSLCLSFVHMRLLPQPHQEALSITKPPAPMGLISTLTGKRTRTTTTIKKSTD